jgi:uncharacterized membrane protein YfcA
MAGLQDVLALLAGGLVGLSLGLIGGGGSILAVPLLLYLVGVASPHVAIGTSAVSVAASAGLSLLNHARAHTVKWPCATVFALSGILGAGLGAQVGKAIDGVALLTLFGLLMIAVGLFMLRLRRGGERADIRLTLDSARELLPRLVGTGLAVGAVSGFFGIGGGFLIVPGLIGATAMPLLNAIGSSLVSVSAFGATAATSYALAGLVDWRVAVFFIGGGAFGGMLGAWMARRLGARKRTLDYVFAAVVLVTGVYSFFPS